MKVTGTLLKMESKLADVVEYTLPIGAGRISMNALISKEIHITFRNEIRCLSCGNKTKKSYGQGFCYPCFIKVPETSECVLRPELCQAHLGISRDMEWSKGHCLQEHYVYLAITSGLKVGVTRVSQVPTRWIDQGASKAICLAKTPNRFTAGQIEVLLKKKLDDKTNWRNMLTGKIIEDSELSKSKEEAYKLLPDDLKKYYHPDNTITEICYPMSFPPEKVTSISLDTVSEVSGILTGIKGQYLIFAGGEVLNVRKHNGYLVALFLK